MNCGLFVPKSMSMSCGFFVAIDMSTHVVVCSLLRACV
jgi:hypothetical protein